MGQSTKVVTTVGNIDIIEVVTRDLEGDITGTSYYVQGEKHNTLKEARESAKKLSDEGEPASVA